MPHRLKWINRFKSEKKGRLKKLSSLDRYAGNTSKNIYHLALIGIAYAI